MKILIVDDIAYLREELFFTDVNFNDKYEAINYISKEVTKNKGTGFFRSFCCCEKNTKKQAKRLDFLAGGVL